MRRKILMLGVLGTLVVATAGCLAYGAGAAMAAIPEGTWLWTAPVTTGGSGATAVTALAKGPADSVYATGPLGLTSPDRLSGAKALLARVTAAGATLWQRAILGPTGAGARVAAVAVDRTRAPVVVGSTASRGGDGFVARYSRGGKLRWTRSFGRSGVDAATAVAVDASGSVYVAGYISSAADGRDAILVKYDAAGTRRWSSVLSTAKDDEYVGLALDSSGSPYAVGTRFADATYSQIVTVKLHPGGRLVWRRYVDLEGTLSVGVKLVVRSAGAAAGVYVAGTRTSGDALNPLRPRIGKYRLDGTVLWGAPLAVPLTALGDIAVDAEGRTVLAGDQYDAASSHACGLVGFVDASGALVSSLRFANDQTGVPGGLPAGLTRVAVDAAGRSYASGWIAGDAASTATAAVVVRCPSMDAGAEAFDRLWRSDGPVAGADGTFRSVLVAGDAAVYAAGSWNDTGGAIRGIVRRLDPATSR